MAFVPPDAERRARAIGSVSELPVTFQRAFDPDGFDPIPAPARDDWLNVAAEKGQSFEGFTRAATNRAEGTRQHIYVQPIGEVLRAQHELLLQLQAFGSAFFARPVRLLPPIDVLVGTGIAERTNTLTGVTQLKTRDILPLLARKSPADAMCVLGFTAYDLYPDDGWNFVFGEAMLDERVGVFSVARYDPRFYDKPADPALLLRRASKVLAHETCHMRGIRHCIFFNGLMNGSNHLAESDRRPLEVCPVDLRKLHWLLGFDIVERYRILREFWRGAGIGEPADWIERRLASIENADA